MKGTAAIALLATTGLMMGVIPVAALSCEEPQPFDMGRAISFADAAAIGVITSLSAVGDEGWEEVTLTVQVDEVFKGTAPTRVVLERHETVWGPFYEEGQELALLIHNDVVSDGQQELCGPFFSPADMRQAGGEPTIAVGEPHPLPEPQPNPWNMFGFLDGLFDLLRFILTF